MGDINLQNYVVGFFDLLGQRNAMRGEGLLVQHQTAEAEAAFRTKVKASIGAILALQLQAEDMLRATLRHRRDSPLRLSLPKKDRETWDAMHKSHVTTQRWSDGLVHFMSLGNEAVKCPMTGVFAMFGLAGSLCFIGLATKRPVRGAIEIAWGAELHKGELYGPAVARAYELESEAAQYPRIVIGPEAVRYLAMQAKNPGEDMFSQNNRALAELCLNMVVQDADGHSLLHYLGETFRTAVSTSQHAEMFEQARTYVVQQLQEHQKSKNGKLAFRYTHLLNYFEAHHPAAPQGAA